MGSSTSAVWLAEILGVMGEERVARLFSPARGCEAGIEFYENGVPDAVSLPVVRRLLCKCPFSDALLDVSSGGQCPRRLQQFSDPVDGIIHSLGLHADLIVHFI